MNRKIKFRAEPRLKRKAASRQPRTVVYIYCEGQKTEPEYIQAFFREFGKKEEISLQPIIGGRGVASTIIDLCMTKKSLLNDIAKKRKKLGQTPFEQNDVVWAVFDVDGQTISEMISLKNKAEHNGIRCAISNASFEVWGLMHQSAYNKPGTQQDVQTELASLMPPYHHKNNPVIPWEHCRLKISTAIKNSRLVNRAHKKERTPHPEGNSSTNIHELLLFLAGKQSHENL